MALFAGGGPPEYCSFSFQKMLEYSQSLIWLLRDTILPKEPV